MKWLGRIFERLFVRDAIGAEREAISDYITIIRTKNPERPIILRFSHKGDTEYHQLTTQEVQNLHAALAPKEQKDKAP